MPWHIHTWDRALARGSITSPDSSARYEFDASVAMVDDFVVGEAVEIRLEKIDGAPRVTWIAPVSARPNPASADTTPLPAELEAALREANRLLARDNALVRATHFDGTKLELEVHKYDWPPPHGDILGRLTCDEVGYLQPPPAFEPEGRRLVAYPWPHFELHNRALVRSWSADPLDLGDHRYVFAFESPEFGAFTAYVVADGLSVG